jgi:hypothetical protein
MSEEQREILFPQVITVAGELSAFLFMNGHFVMCSRQQSRPAQRGETISHQVDLDEGEKNRTKCEPASGCVSATQARAAAL